MIWTKLYGPISAAADVTLPFDLGNLTNYSYQAVFSGADVVGTFKLQDCNDDTTYLDISGKSTSVTGSASTKLGETVANARYVRGNWDYTSGTGNITVYFQAKEINLQNN